MRRGLAAVFAVGLLSIHLARAPVHAAVHTCWGHAPDIVGTPGDDYLVGGPGQTVIVGLGGDDTIVGRGYPPGGIDILCGNDGNDVIRGGSGGDYMLGGRGDDRLLGRGDADRIYGEGGKDFLDAGKQSGPSVADLLSGGPGDDTLSGRHADHAGVDGFGDSGDDKLVGGSGPDSLDGEGGDDLLVGGSGQDLLEGGTGSDHIDGGAGHDGSDNELPGPYTPGLSGGPGSDMINGGKGDDTLVGDEGRDDLQGGEGKDRLYPDEEDEVIDGGPGGCCAHFELARSGVRVETAPEAGPDVVTLVNIGWVSGSEFADELWGDERVEQIYGGGGNDIIHGSSAADDLVGGKGDDLLEGGLGDDELEGREGQDVIHGGAGTDDLEGGCGWFFGCQGDDRDQLFGDQGTDWLSPDQSDVIIDGGEGDDGVGFEYTATAGVRATFGNSPSPDVLSLTSIELGVNGSRFDDEFWADDAGRDIDGRAGNDIVHGGAGPDLVEGYKGADTLEGADGDDRLNGGDGDDNVYGGQGDDSLSGEDWITKRNSGQDRLYGQQGRDYLYPDQTDLVVDGGEDDDSVDFQFATASVRASLGAGQSPEILSLQGIELSVGGSRFDDELWGSDSVPELEVSLRGGDDTFHGGLVPDDVNGGLGDDTLEGRSGDDSLEGDLGNDTLEGDSGDDHLSGSNGDDRLRGGVGNDGANGGEGTDFCSEIEIPYSCEESPVLDVRLSGPDTIHVSGDTLTPDAFELTATVTNTSETTIADASLTISPLKGLKDGETPIKQLGNLAPNAEATVSWQLLTGCPPSTESRSYTAFARAGGSELGSDSHGFMVPGHPRGKPVIMVHGYELTGRNDGRATWQDMKNALVGRGWCGPLKTVAFYRLDRNHDMTLDDYGSHQRHSGGNHEHVGVNEDRHDGNTNIRHLGYHLAWLIHERYTRQGIDVEVVGHSMGGLIARYAIAQVQKRNDDFPSRLGVEDVVTFGTPHEGSVFGRLCPFGEQCSQMGSGSEFLGWLSSNARNPQGSGGTDWTVIGSRGDEWVRPRHSATAMDAAHKVMYLGGLIRHGDYVDLNGDCCAPANYSHPGIEGRETMEAPYPVAWAYWALVSLDWSD